MKSGFQIQKVDEETGFSNPLMEASKLPPLHKNAKRKLKPINKNFSKGLEDVTASNDALAVGDRPPIQSKGLVCMSSPISKLQTHG